MQQSLLHIHAVNNSVYFPGQKQLRIVTALLLFIMLRFNVNNRHCTLTSLTFLSILPIVMSYFVIANKIRLLITVNTVKIKCALCANWHHLHTKWCQLAHFLCIWFFTVKVSSKTICSFAFAFIKQYRLWLPNYESQTLKFYISIYW